MRFVASSVMLSDFSKNPLPMDSSGVFDLILMVRLEALYGLLFAAVQSSGQAHSLASDLVSVSFTD
jgi:hypothetical protein